MAVLIGCDFSSRPDKRKPIVIARGSSADGWVVLESLERLESLPDFAAWVARPGDWVGGFDFPFGLPRELVEQLGWPPVWDDCIRHYAGLSRKEIRDQFAEFCAARAVGAKFAHRATDRPAGSSPSMKWVNPPVAYMLHAGVPPLIAAGVFLPGLHAAGPGNLDACGRPRRIALEAYPGLLAREVLGGSSYKSDDKRKQSPLRLAQRERLLGALEAGGTRLGLRLGLTRAQSVSLLMDASGDSLDAVLCLVQAAWGAQRGGPWFGLPETLDPLEGWIVSALPGPQAPQGNAGPPQVSLLPLTL